MSSFLSHGFSGACFGEGFCSGVKFTVYKGSHVVQVAGDLDGYIPFLLRSTDLPGSGIFLSAAVRSPRRVFYSIDAFIYRRLYQWNKKSLTPLTGQLPVRDERLCLTRYHSVCEENSSPLHRIRMLPPYIPPCITVGIPSASTFPFRILGSRSKDSSYHSLCCFAPANNSLDSEMKVILLINAFQLCNLH